MNRKVRRFLALATALALSLVGTACSEDGDGGGEENATPSEGGSWTILYYSMADTSNIEGGMMADVNEMGEVGSGEHLDIVALVDRNPGQDDTEVLDQGNWEGAKLLHIDEGTAEVLEEPGHINMADPETLADFIVGGAEAYPADNYGLILSDHGAPFTGLGPDESADNDELSLGELAIALTAGLEESGIGKLGLLGFDACLMGTYETASAMAPFAERMIASQETEPAHGWDYRTLGSIDERGGATADELGTVLVESYLPYSEQEEEGGPTPDVTLALLDLTQIDAVSGALSAFSTALVERGKAVAPIVGRERAETLGFGKSEDPTEDQFSTDLGLLASAIGSEAPDVSGPADALVQAIDEMVVTSVNGPAAEGASGLAVYFPSELQYMNPDYGTVVGPTGASAWNAYLANYYGVGSAIPAAEIPVAETADGSAELFFDEDGLNIVANFNEASVENLSEAVINYGVVEDDGSVTYIGQEPAVIHDDGSGTVNGIYDLTRLTMSDGEDTTTAYLKLDFEEGDEVGTIAVPMAYYAAGDQEGETYQDVVLKLTFDVESGDIISETYYAYTESETLGELTADPEGIIVPELLNLAEDGTQTWEPATDTGLFADLPNIEYDLVRLDAGTPLQADLQVSDFAGNTASVSMRTEVPAE